MKKILWASIFMSLGLLNNSVLAESINTNINSNATLNAYCKISAQDISFGQVDLLALKNTTVNANGSIDVLCSRSAFYSISPTGGNSHGTSNDVFFIMRGTAGNNDVLVIDFTKVSGQWQSTTSGMNGPITATGNGLSQSNIITAKLTDRTFSGYGSSNTSNVLAKPDNYSATITAIITY